MSSWNEVLVSLQTSIKDVIRILDQSSKQIVLVVDDGQRLLGTVTDGDIRRGILKGVSLTDAVSQIMNPEPTVARVDEGRDSILAARQPRCRWPGPNAGLGN